MGAMKLEYLKVRLEHLTTDQAWLHKVALETFAESVKHHDDIEKMQRDLQGAHDCTRIYQNACNSHLKTIAQVRERRDNWRRRHMAEQLANVRLRELVVRLERRLLDANVPVGEPDLDAILGRNQKHPVEPEEQV